MKRFLYLLPILFAASCATTSGIKSLKNTDPSNVITGCDTCVEVRIKNLGPDNISGVTVENSRGESHYFEGVKSGKTSHYQQFRSLCNCGYNIDVTYFKTDDNQVVLKNSCQNILPCHDFLKGKVTIEVNTPKLPDTLSQKTGRRIHTDVHIVKD